LPDGELMTIYDAAMRYRAEGTPLIVLAGREYGSGSSRDQAAKGPAMLGVRAVLAESFERIHRANLAGMGILPLQLHPGQGATALGLTGREVFAVDPLPDDFTPRGRTTVRARRPDGTEIAFPVVVRLDNEAEVEYYRQGGILPTVLRRVIR